MPLIVMFGAKDPEMNEIEYIAGKCCPGLSYPRPATVNGVRVHAGNAYAADSHPKLKQGDTLFCIECRPREIPDGVNVVVIDHHRPGDPGYGLPPSKFWEASSLGQFVRMIESDEYVIGPDWSTHPGCYTHGSSCRTADEAIAAAMAEWLPLAAMDHCPGAAFRGECPDVTPESVIPLRVREIAKGTSSPEDEVREKIEFFTKTIAKAPVTLIGVTAIADLRELHLGAGYSLALLAAQTASLISATPVLLKHEDTTNAPEKWTLYNAPPAAVLAFKEKWALGKLVHIYGVPERGYAGGYVE
jgi:hypothetical protein